MNESYVLFDTAVDRVARELECVRCATVWGRVAREYELLGTKDIFCADLQRRTDCQTHAVMKCYCNVANIRLV